MDEGEGCLTAVGAVAGVIAAVFAIIGVWLQIWWRRPDLTIDFAPGATPSSQERVTVTMQVHNHADQVAHVTAEALLNGREVPGTRARQSIKPHTQVGFGFRLPRPEVADVGPGGEVVFHGQLTARVKMGWRKKVLAYGALGTRLP